MLIDATTPIWFGSLAHWSRGEDWRIALAHARQRHVLLLLKRGQGLGLLNGARHGLGTHNLLSLPPGCVFSLTLAKQSIGLVMDVDDPSVLGLPQRPMLLRLREVTAIGEATGLFEAGIREIEQARPFVHDALDAHGRLLSTWLKRQMLVEEYLHDEGDLAQRLTAKLFTQMGQVDPGTMPLTERAKALGVTPTHLSRACKVSTGMTAAVLLNQQVLHRARDLLDQGHFSVQDIARYLGFGTASYFTRFIQKHTGQAPSHWRRGKAQQSHISQN